MILLSWNKKSRLVSFVDRGPPSWEQFCRLEKENVSTATGKVTDQSETSTSSGSPGLISSSLSAQLVQNAANEFCGQPEEVNAFLGFFKAQFPALRGIQELHTFKDGSERSVCSIETLEQDMYFSILRELHDNLLHSDFSKEDTKIPTAEGGFEKGRDTESVLLGKYIVALWREKKESPSGSQDSHNDEASVESTSKCPSYDGFGPSDCDGVHISSCGHAVHQGCLDRYLSSLKER